MATSSPRLERSWEEIEVKRIDLTAPAPGMPGPNIIGGSGGSGTHVVARIAREGGMFIGTNLNVSEDALDFADYLDRWMNIFMMASKMSAWSPPSRAAMIRDLQRVLGKHLAPLHPTARAWGWKEPRSMFLLPFLHSQFPTMRFLHVIRDGRDIAYSTNQNQLRKHGWLLDTTELRASQPMRSMALWSRVNLVTADYGENIPRTQYLRIRFEDLCHQPVPVIIQIFGFFGLSGEANHIARAEVRPPESLDRWRTQGRDTLAELRQLGHVALERFGYRGTL
jgi:hypothetical protein